MCVEPSHTQAYGHVGEDLRLRVFAARTVAAPLLPSLLQLLLFLGSFGPIDLLGPFRVLTGLLSWTHQAGARGILPPPGWLLGDARPGGVHPGGVLLDGGPMMTIFFVAALLVALLLDLQTANHAACSHGVALGAFVCPVSGMA